MSALPPDLSRYRHVLNRFGEYRVSGKGVSVRCPFPDRHGRGDKNPSTRFWVGTRGELVCRCMACRATWSEFVAASGLSPAAWWPNEERTWMETPKVTPRETARYAYHDADGQLIGWKVRLEPGYHGEAKTFVWERPHPANLPNAVVRGLREGIYTPVKRGNGQVVYSVQAETTEHSIPIAGVDHLLNLYRLPELIKSRPEMPVLVVEGEKVADELRRIGFRTVTTGYAGFGKWDFHWGQYLAGRRVTIIPDRDPKDAALAYAYAVAGSALYYQASEIRLVLIPPTELPPKGGDVCHWMAGKGLAIEDKKARYEAVLSLIKRSDFYAMQR